MSHECHTFCRNLNELSSYLLFCHHKFYHRSDGILASSSWAVIGQQTESSPLIGCWGMMSLLPMLSDSSSDKTNAGWKIWNIVRALNDEGSPYHWESWAVRIFYTSNDSSRWQLNLQTHSRIIKTPQNLILTRSLGWLSHLFGLTINSIKLKMNWPEWSKWAMRMRITLSCNTTHYRAILRFSYSHFWSPLTFPRHPVNEFSMHQGLSKN